MNKSITKQYIQKMIKILPFILTIFLSCTPSKTAVLDPTFLTIYKSQNGGSEKSGYLHIKNNEDYIQYIEGLKVEDSEFDQLTTVNFKENDVIILNQGNKTSGGFAIDVASISWENETLLIKKIESTPKKGEMVTMVLTSPYSITTIPKAKNIKMIE